MHIHTKDAQFIILREMAVTVQETVERVKGSYDLTFDPRNLVFGVEFVLKSNTEVRNHILRY